VAYVFKPAEKREGPAGYCHNDPETTIRADFDCFNRDALVRKLAGMLWGGGHNRVYAFSQIGISVSLWHHFLWECYVSEYEQQSKKSAVPVIRLCAGFWFYGDIISSTGLVR